MHGSDEPCDVPAFMWGRRIYEYPGEYLGSGNRCGHNPAQLATDRLALPEPKGGHRIAVIRRLIDKAHTYFVDPASVPLLAYLGGKTNRDGSPRQNRSEGREAQALVLSAIIAALDLKSLRVGTYTTRGEFKPLPFDEIARRCGLTRPVENPDDPAEIEHVACSRFWRAVSWLKRAQVIEVYEQYEETTEGKRGRPAIKTVSEKFLRILGGMTKAAMKKARDKSSRAVGRFVGAAVMNGHLSKDEEDALSDDLRSQAVKHQLFPRPKAKNQAPKGIEPENSSDNLKAIYDGYVQSILDKIAAALGRPLQGAERIKLFAKYGGVTFDAWQRTRQQ